MFESYSRSNTDIKINAVTGTITKNYKNSFFVNFELNGFMANRLFSANPKVYDRETVVLQIMLCADKSAIAEVMFKDDFDKLFQDEKIDKITYTTGTVLL